MGIKWSSGCKCCGLPVIAISTIDSSVEYTHLCNFEDANGLFPPFFPNGPPDCSVPIGAADGFCVKAPKANDIARYTADRQAIIDMLDLYGDEWPLAAGEIVGKFRCWAGVKAAVVTAGEPDPEDSFGAMEIKLSGTGTNARISLVDLQDLFWTLFDKHPRLNPGGTRDTEADFVFLFDVDNSGSISLFEWPNAVKTAFDNWVTTTFPKCQVRQTTISNYLVDTERWLMRLKNNYINLLTAKEFLP